MLTEQTLQIKHRKENMTNGTFPVRQSRSNHIFHTHLKECKNIKERPAIIAYRVMAGLSPTEQIFYVILIKQHFLLQLAEVQI